MSTEVLFQAVDYKELKLYAKEILDTLELYFLRPEMINLLIQYASRQVSEPAMLTILNTFKYTHVYFDPISDYFYACENSRINRYNIQTGKKKTYPWKLKGEVYFIEVASKHQKILVNFKDRTSKLYDLKNPSNKLPRIVHKTNEMPTCKWSPNQNYLLLGYSYLKLFSISNHLVHPVDVPVCKDGFYSKYYGSQSYGWMSDKIFWYRTNIGTTRQFFEIADENSTVRNIELTVEKSTEMDQEIINKRIQRRNETIDINDTIKAQFAYDDHVSVHDVRYPEQVYKIVPQYLNRFAEMIILNNDGGIYLRCDSDTVGYKYCRITYKSNLQLAYECGLAMRKRDKRKIIKKQQRHFCRIS